MTGPQGQRPRVDWDAAKAFYVALPPAERSYGRVATEFGVSQTTAQKRAKRHGWPVAAQAADAEADRIAMSKIVKTRAERVASVLKFVDAAVDHASTKLTAKNLDVKASDVASLVKLAELLTGEPTDRIQIAQLQPLLDAYDSALDELVNMAPDRPAAEAIVSRLDDELLAYAATARSREQG